MAKEYSFDIVSEVDMQVVDDVVNTANKDIQNRFDLKGTDSEIVFERKDKQIVLIGNADFVVKQVRDILNQKMAKRNLNPKIISLDKKEVNNAGKVREQYKIIIGIEKELAKSIVKDIKGAGIKVQASIQDEQIRVTGKDKDDLQQVIQFLKEKDYPIALQFTNYR